MKTFYIFNNLYLYFVLGDNMNLFLRSDLSYRSFERTMTSLTYMLPDPRLWSPKETLIITPNANYSAHDYKKYFKDIGFEVGTFNKNFICKYLYNV